MLNITFILIAVYCTVYCIFRIWRYWHEKAEYLFTLAMWMCCMACIWFIYITMTNEKNTLHSYPCDQCIYETKIVKVQDGTIMPVEIWVGCKNEQCEFKNSR
jgi:hypothetical protein